MDESTVANDTRQKIPNVLIKTLAESSASRLHPYSFNWLSVLERQIHDGPQVLEVLRKLPTPSTLVSTSALLSAVGTCSTWTNPSGCEVRAPAP